MNDSLAGEIIVQAFSEGGFQPRAKLSMQEELHEALPRLNNLFHALVGLELGEKYRDWPIPPNRASSIPARYPRGPLEETPTEEQWTHPPANVRLMAANTGAVTVYFPSAPQDGARMAYADVGAAANVTLHGNGRLIQGAASIEGEGGWKRWFYRADRGEWICLDQLTMNTEMPLPPEFDDLFICGLVMRLAPRFKAEVSKYIVARYGDMLERAKLRYVQSVEMPATSGRLDFPIGGEKLL